MFFVNYFQVGLCLQGAKAEEGRHGEDLRRNRQRRRRQILNLNPLYLICRMHDFLDGSVVSKERQKF